MGLRGVFIIILGVGLTAASLTAHAIDADRCRDVRLDGKGGSLEHVFGLTQSATSCQTHAALVAYDAWRFKHDAKDLRRSAPGPTYVEQCAVGRITSGTGWSGWPDLTLSFLKDHPPCPVGEIRTINGRSYDPVEGFAVGVEDALYSRRLQGTELAQAVTGCAQAGGSTPVVDMSRPEFSGVMAKLTAFGEMAPFINTHCGANDRLKAPAYEVAYGSDAELKKQSSEEKKRELTLDQSKNLKFVQDGFDAKREETQPFMITYCSYKLENKGIVNGDICGGHTVVIIGRRYNAAKKSCEFLYRNSQPQAGNDSVDPQNHWVDALDFLASSDEVTQIQAP